MRRLEHEDIYIEQIRMFLKESGTPNALVLTVKQVGEIMQLKSRKSVYNKFNVVNGRVQIAEVAKELCKTGNCKTA